MFFSTFVNGPILNYHLLAVFLALHLHMCYANRQKAQYREMR